MMPRTEELPETELLTWLFRAVGAVAGSAISLAYFLPHRKRDAFTRLVVGVTSGLIFGAPAGVRLTRLFEVRDHVTALETNLIGATAVSLTAWWALGLAKRAMRSRGVFMYDDEEDDRGRR